MSISVFRAVPTLVIVSILLSGCVAAAGPTTRPTNVPSSTPTPTEALTAPRSALPLTCAQIMSLSRVQSHLTDTVSVKVDETHPPVTIGDLAVLQAGGTECVWGGENMTDATYDTGVSLAILPDGTDGYTALATNPQTEWETRNTIGQASGFHCTETGDTSGDWCNGDALISGYWVSFIVDDIGGAKGPDSTNVVMADVASAIAGAGPARSNWTPPVASISGSTWCTDSGSASRVSGAIGAAMTLSPADSGYDATFGTIPVASGRSALVTCRWEGADGQNLAFATLPAGGWALPLVASQPPIWTLLGRPATFSVTGSEGAVFACGDGCQAMVAVDGSLLQIYESGNDDVSPTFASTVQKLVDAAKAG